MFLLISFLSNRKDEEIKTSLVLAFIRNVDCQKASRKFTLPGNCNRCVRNAFDFWLLITKVDSLISPNELGFQKKVILIIDTI